MSRLSSSRSKLVSSVLALLSAASLTACPPVEFEGDPGAGGHQASAGGTSRAGSGGDAATGAGGASSIGTTGGVSTSAGGALSTEATGGSSQAAAGSAAVGGSSSTAPTRFATFRLRRTAGMGLCVQPSQAQDAQFTRDAEGRLVLSGTRFHAVREQPDEVCPEGTSPFANVACLTQLPTIRLTVEQTATLDQLIAALPTGQCEPDPGVMCDPCLVTMYQIDSRSEYGGCCGQQKAPAFDDLFAAIGDFVDGLIRQPAILLHHYVSFSACAVEGEGLDVALKRGDRGMLAMSGTYLAKKVQSKDQCPLGTDSSQSDVACIGTLPSVELTALETAKLDQLLLEVPVGQCNRDQGRACDVCELAELVWGSRTETSHCCGTQETPGFDLAFPAAVSYIDELIRKRNPYGS